MTSRYALLLSFIIVGASCVVCAGQNGKRVSLCSIQQTPQSYLHTIVEVRASIFIGGASQLEEGKCSFLFAFGDDYQTLGRRFRVKHNRQWAQMQKLLRTPPRATVPSMRELSEQLSRAWWNAFLRLALFPRAEMGLHVVILSVSGVRPVPIKCDPPNVHFLDPVSPQGGRANLREHADEVGRNRRRAFWDLSAMNGRAGVDVRWERPIAMMECVCALYKFTGKERDTETGLNYFGARYYGSNVGRFTSPDPLYLEMLRQPTPNNETSTRTVEIIR